METEAFKNGYTDLRKGWLLRAALFLCSLIFAYWALVSVTPLFPVLRLNEHLKDAALLLEKEGEYWMPFGQMPTMDNYTDAITLNIIGTLNPHEPIRSAMRMDVSYAPDDTEPGQPIRDFKNFVEGKAMKTWSYARYWHGDVVFLRPMLSVMTFADVRKLSFFVLMILFSSVMLLLARRTYWIVTLGFAVSMTLGGFPLLAFCMEYVDSFVIAISIMCVILRSNIRDEESLVWLFLLSGSLTTFIGFGGLTAPIVTFMFPLLSLVLPDLETQSFRWDWRYVKRLLLFGIVWSAGYLLTWGAKWVLADAILGGEDSVLRDAMNSILFRTGSAEGMRLFDRMLVIVRNIYAILPFSVMSSGEGKAPAIYAIIQSVAETEGSRLDKLALTIKEVAPILPSSIFLGLVVTVLVLVVYLVAVVSLAIDGKRRRPIGALGYFSLAFLFLVPYFWYFVTANNANHHYITFRNQIPSLWLFLILPHSMKKKEID
ncbi:MAG: hypothetical protein FWG71_04215 [Synergistaceae bacterium]|nr:hypothetical protein [Synergistaceae bacterium]